MPILRNLSIDFFDTVEFISAYKISWNCDNRRMGFPVIGNIDVSKQRSINLSWQCIKVDTSPWLIRHPADRYPAIVYCGGPWQRLCVYCCLVQQYFNIVSHSLEPSTSGFTAVTHFQVSTAGFVKLQNKPVVFPSTLTSSNQCFHLQVPHIYRESKECHFG